MQHVFYYYPITCATSAHIILVESGLTFDREMVDLREGKHLKSDFLLVNPKGSVPAIDTPYGLLTENQAILTYIADLVPEKCLIPPAGDFARASAHEWMNFCAASLHPAVRSVFRPTAYTVKSDHAIRGVRSHGLVMMDKYGEFIEQQLNENQWSLGDHFSVADAYLYLMYLWSRDKRMGSLTECPKWRKLALKVHQRASTQEVLTFELAQRSEYRLPEGFITP